MKTGIEVKTEYFPLAWLLYFCTPVVEINGQKNKRSWGTHFFELPAGSYQVRIYFPYIFMKECGANQINVNVMEGQIKKIFFNMPPLMTSKGSISEL